MQNCIYVKQGIVFAACVASFVFCLDLKAEPKESLENIVRQHNRLALGLGQSIVLEKPHLKDALVQFFGYWKSLQTTENTFTQRGNGDFKLALTGTFERKKDLFSDKTVSVLQRKNLEHTLPELTNISSTLRSARKPLAWEFKLAETTLTFDHHLKKGVLNAREFNIPRQRGETPKLARGMVLFFSPNKILLRSDRATHLKEPINVKAYRRPKSRR